MSAGGVEAYYLGLVDGTRRGLLAALLRGVLVVCAAVFAWIVRARGFAYDRGLLRVTRVGCPVVSVGNLTAGGTGKTPMVERVARELIRRGFRPAVVSRGYRGAAGQPNDEAQALAERLPEVPHVQDPDRVRGSRAAIELHRADAIILDDGFQHRRIARDLDIVLLDATAPPGHGWLLPRGLLREPVSALRRAKVVVLTRADLVPPDALARLRARIERAAPGVPICEAALEAGALRRLGAPLAPSGPAAPADAPTLDGRKVIALSAIGNPAAFAETLRRLGANVVGEMALRDHHAYRVADLDRAFALAEERAADLVVTTHKDAVKLVRLPGAPGAPASAPVPVYVFDVELVLTSGSADWHAALDAAVGLASERAA